MKKDFDMRLLESVQSVWNNGEEAVIKAAMDYLKQLEVELSKLVASSCGDFQYPDGADIAAETVARKLFKECQTAHEFASRFVPKVSQAFDPLWRMAS
ncbi:hypothetical protein GF376_04860 [Candidatus Peregrinibacteria bacterium]|nr:hypothetical protein [Candidatus Peregrinibacteria bacterium]